MHAITLPHSFSPSSSRVPRHSSSNLTPILRSSSRGIFQRIKCSSAEVAQTNGTESLSAKERRRLRNERRQDAIQSKPPWREVVEEKLLRKVRKPSVNEELDMNKLAALGLRWWRLDVRKNSERLAVKDLQVAFAMKYPDVEFEVFLPAAPSTKKLKNGAYSKKIKVLIPGCIFIRCCLNEEIHDFILSSPRVYRFSGKLIGKGAWKIIKPIPLSDFEMEFSFLKTKQRLEKYEREIKDEILKEERNETKDDVVGKDLSHNFDVEDFNIDKNANLHANSLNDLSNNDVSGKDAGSFGIKSISEKSSTGFSSSIRTDHVNELFLKRLKKQDTTKEERKKLENDSVRQGFVEDFEIGDILIDKDTNFHAHFENDSVRQGFVEDFEMGDILIDKDTNFHAHFQNDSVRQDFVEDVEMGDILIDKNTNFHAHFADESSNIDISGKQIGSSGAQFNSKNLSNMFADSTSLNYATEPSLKGLDEQHKHNIHDSELVEGSTVRITSGPLAEFTGHLEGYDLKTGKAKVMLMMFGQETPVDVEINQFEYES